MSLAMNRTLPSSRSTGAMKPTRTYGTSSVGTSSSTYGSSTRMSKQAHSSSSRALPSGPGPLPNKLSIPDKSRTRTGPIKFVAASKAEPVGHKKSYGMDSPAARRKTSNDSGYASSSRTSYGDLRSGKSKSLSQLNPHRGEINDLLRSPSNRRRNMESSVQGISSRTGHSYTQNHVGTKGPLNGGSNTKSSSTSIYRSTTHLDYRDPKEERKSLHNGGQSLYSSHKDLSNAYTTTGKDNYSVRDVDKARKATITALPGSDMKCARNSSISSSNSSSSNSVSICSRKLINFLVISSSI